jgi:hypothetical protein
LLIIGGTIPKSRCQLGLGGRDTPAFSFKNNFSYGAQKNFKKNLYLGLTKKIFKKYATIYFFLLIFALVFSLIQILVP